MGGRKDAGTREGGKERGEEVEGGRQCLKTQPYIQSLQEYLDVLQVCFNPFHVG